MEYLENDNERSFYWIIFFIFVIAVVVLGYFFVLHPSKQKLEKEKHEEEVEIDYDKYIGKWYVASENGYSEDMELEVLKFDGSTVIFSLSGKKDSKIEEESEEEETSIEESSIEGTTEETTPEKQEETDKYEFPSINAEFDDEKALFEINEENISFSGTISFKNDIIYLVITSSSDENLIQTGTTRFDHRA